MKEGGREEGGGAEGSGKTVSVMFGLWSLDTICFDWFLALDVCHSVPLHLLIFCFDISRILATFVITVRLRIYLTFLLTHVGITNSSIEISRPLYLDYTQQIWIRTASTSNLSLTPLLSLHFLLHVPLISHLPIHPLPSTSIHHPSTTTTTTTTFHQAPTLPKKISHLPFSRVVSMEAVWGWVS